MPKNEHGEAGFTKGLTIQVRQFEPVRVEFSLTLPVEDGETPQDALKRVKGIVEEVFDETVSGVLKDGWKWGKS